MWKLYRVSVVAYMCVITLACRVLYRAATYIRGVRYNYMLGDFTCTYLKNEQL